MMGIDIQRAPPRPRDSSAPSKAVSYTHLIDIRHEPSALDRNMVQFLMDAELPFAIALTKADKLSKQQQMKQRAAIKKALKLPGGVPMVVTSSEKGDGIDELRALINRAIER